MNLFVLTVQYAFYYFLHTFLYIFLFQEDISEHFATFGEIDNINLKELQILLIAIHGGGGAWEPEPGVFGSLEPEPAEKKTRGWSRSKKKRELEPQKICHSCNGS